MAEILQSSGCANLRDQEKDPNMLVEKVEISGETKSLTST